jgi:hypothetical protein
MGYDDEGALPEIAVYVCARCRAEMDTDREIVREEGGEA